jgi:hypothetical protein
MDDTPINTSYNCEHCLKTSSNKPWVSIRLPDKVFNTCSYLCYVKGKHELPKNHFNLIINKEDYEGIIVPVQFHRPVFTPLTESEINLLTNEQYADYKVKLEEHFPSDSMFADPSFVEECHSILSEEEYESDSSSDNDTDEY